MKLEVGKIRISDIRFADASRVEDGVLYVDARQLEELVLEQEGIKAVSFDVARPGESVRITPVKDVIEPRVKVEGPGQVFPGMVGPVDTVGSGRTHALSGMAVVTAGPIVGFQEGIIDMAGPGARYTPFSSTVNLVAVFEPHEGIEAHHYEHDARMAGLRIAAIETHVADARTCCLHPASSTHRQMTDDELVAAGVMPNMVRLSCGLEDAADLIADVEQALAQL